MPSEEATVSQVAAQLRDSVQDVQVQVHEHGEEPEGFVPDMVVQKGDDVWLVELKVGEGPLDTTDLAQLRGYLAEHGPGAARVMLATTRGVSEALRRRALDWNVVLVTGTRVANLISAVAQAISTDTAVH